MYKIFKLFASPMLMVVMLVLLAFSSGIATFFENDFGSQAARALVYNAWWFELIFIVLSINLTLSVIINKLYRREKFSVFLFHISFVIIVIGAAVTRYAGQEGMLHIREGETAVAFASSDTWLEVFANGELVNLHRANFSTVTKNRLKSSFTADNIRVNYYLTNFIPNAVETVVEHPDGNPLISIIVMDSIENLQVLIEPEKPFKIGITNFGLEEVEGSGVRFFVSDSGAIAISSKPLSVLSMMGGESKVDANQWFKLQQQVIYRTDETGFTFRGYLPKAKVVMAYSSNPTDTGIDALAFSVKVNDQTQDIFVPRGEPNGKVTKMIVEGVEIGFRFGPRRVEMPFSIKLNDFVLERYPGSNSPSSFTSNVTVFDTENGIEKPFSIYMNNILNYRGHRFYQSSYDTDERGTYLSVNKDFAGTAITYFGYFIMILGMVWALIAPGTRFRKLLSKTVPAFLLLIICSFNASAQPVTLSPVVPSKFHAREFGHVLVQDKGGRMKPVSTLAGETLRKLNRSNRFMGFTPEQVFIGMSTFPEHWQHVPVVKVSNDELKQILGIKGDLAAFTDFFNFETGGNYKLSRVVQDAFAVKPARRSALQKDIVKVDERVNVLYMIFSGQLARIFPVPDHPENRWYSMAEAVNLKDSLKLDVAVSVFENYISDVRIAVNTGNWTKPSSTVSDFISYQIVNGSQIAPSGSRVRLEVLTNRLLPFERLIPIYGLTGLIMLVLVFIQLLSSGSWVNLPYRAFSFVLLLGFIFHTVAIGFRWYIAGRAPLSNGYESMVYVAWASMLAGFLFANRSRVVLPATALLSTLTLFVAHLSWMDPEITNLVPVLKSYWLTIHVAVITASYGFLGLGAILGFINLSLLSLKNNQNMAMIQKQVDEISTINELSLTIGLYLLTIGSFLGAVWANESWGRYWGWDPKETWAFITIIVYTFIIHMRLIPAFRTSFSFNFASLIGIGSVLMTYFGVNYYLSGLHSYAGGDPLPMPSWIYFAVAAVLSFSFFAWYNDRVVEGKGRLLS